MQASMDIIDEGCWKRDKADYSLIVDDSMFLTLAAMCVWLVRPALSPLKKKMGEMCCSRLGERAVHLCVVLTRHARINRSPVRHL
jgi:hypothetical protein